MTRTSNVKLFLVHQLFKKDKAEVSIGGRRYSCYIYKLLKYHIEYVCTSLYAGTTNEISTVGESLI
jgi:hypothetical protein